MRTMEEMKNYLRTNNLTHLVRELVRADWDSDYAIEFVYDQHTMSKKDFCVKHYGMNFCKENHLFGM